MTSVGTALGLFQQSAVDPDDRQRRLVVPLQFIDSRIRGVENAEAIGAARDVEAKIGPPVDEDALAVEAEHVAMHAAPIGELVRLVERAILQDERNLVFARRQAERALFLVLDKDAAGQAAIDLRRRRLMRMRMIEIEAGAIPDLELVDIGLAGLDGGGRMTVHLHRHMQAVPMRDGLFGEFVAQPDAHLLAFRKPNERAEMALRRRRQRMGRPGEQIAGVAPDLRGLARQDGHRVPAADEFEVDVGLEAFARRARGGAGHAGAHGARRRREGGRRRQKAAPVQPEAL